MLLIDLAAPKLGLPVDQAAINSVTRGLVGDSSFAVLPNVTPRTTFTLTILFQLVSSRVLAFVIVVKLTLHSSGWSNYSSNQHGRLSSAPLRFAATRRFCSVGMSMRKPFSLLSFHSACWHSRIGDTWAPLDLWQSPDTFRSSHFSSQPQSSR